jgi:uncharacterized membrane protein
VDILIIVLQIIYGAFFCFAGIMHFIRPNFFKHFIPDFFPKKLVNYVIGIIEFALGLGIFFPQTVKTASLGIIFLLIFLLPIHIWDVTRKRPAIGSIKLAIIRIPFQFVLMYGVYLIYLHS